MSAPKKTARQGAEVVPLRPSRKCPVCGKDSVRAYHPFCSKRCADVDLNRWLSGRYVIPGHDDENAAPAVDDHDEG